MKRFSILTVLLLIFSLQSKSQDILPAERMDLLLEVAPGDNSMSANDTTFLSTTNVISKVVLALQDTVHLSKIHVKLGSTPNSQNLLSKYFVFDATGTLSDGTSYTRDGNVVYLNLGSRTGIQNYYAEIKLEDTYGRFTDPVQLSGN